MTAIAEDTHVLPRLRAAASSGRGPAMLETVAVLASPVVLYVVLRLRGMAPPHLPDPSMHTTFILDPHDIFARFEALFTPSARLREAARVGFLVPARVSYLLFGAVPGFYVYRYLLALIAIVPLYLLLKRLYGRWAGFLGIAVVMSSPVLLTAWGTDYPDSASVSYLTGGFAALALSFHGRRGARWLMTAGALLMLAVWSHGASVPLVVVLGLVYLGVRLRRERAGIVQDVGLLALSAIMVTVLLAICSKLLIGQLNFIAPTVKSAQTLSTPAELRFNHSASWSWAPYVPYLLVPPGIVVSFFAVFARRWRSIGTPQLFVGLTAALQLAAFAYLQFFSSFQALEMHYFSSLLWSSVNIVLAVTLAETARPIVARTGAERESGSGPAEHRSAPVGGWIAGFVPALLVLAVALAYEAADKLGRHVPAMTWARWGVVVAAVLIAAAVVGRLTIERRRAGDDLRNAPWLAPSRFISAATIVVITGAALILTVAPPKPHGRLANTTYDPTPAYAGALGGNDSAEVAVYNVDAKLPRFVGPAAYRGEVLMTWEPRRQWGDLLGPMGIYHNAFTWVSGTFPVLGRGGVRKVEAWRTAQVLLMSLTGDRFPEAVRSLARFQPVVVRRAVLASGGYRLHVWLVDLGRYLRHPSI